MSETKYFTHMKIVIVVKGIQKIDLVHTTYLVPVALHCVKLCETGVKIF